MLHLEPGALLHADRLARAVPPGDYLVIHVEGDAVLLARVRLRLNGGADPTDLLVRTRAADLAAMQVLDTRLDMVQHPEPV